MSESIKNRSSLQRFLLIVVLVSIAVPALITGFVFIRENFNRTVEQDSRVSANSYIDLLQAGMTMPLWNVKPELGQPLVDAVSIDSSVLGVSVIAENGEDFLTYRDNKVTEDNKDQLTLSREIILNDEILGTVSLAYSFDRARNRAYNESRLLLSIIIIQLASSVALVSYFIRRRVILPLSQLEQAAAGIARGDLKTSIPSLKNDEFGGLSTQLENMRRSLDESFDTLEERVKERTTDLEQVNSELIGTLDTLQRAQGDLVQSEKLAALGSLVAGVSHELNTPIGNGLTVASSLNDSTKKMNRLMEEGMTKSALDEYLQDMTEGTDLVVNSLDRASELVSSFKQVAVDRTSAKRRHFVLSDMLNETLVTMSPVFKNTPFTIRLECSPEIKMTSYPGPLGQIITNLLNNALIHAFDQRDAGEIEIAAEHLENDCISLTVSDNGVGIPAENINKIFDPFFTTKLGEGGNGLGMHIVHNIVEAVLGGDISVHSEINVGTTFMIVVPRVFQTLNDLTDQLSESENNRKNIFYDRSDSDAMDHKIDDFQASMQDSS